MYDFEDTEGFFDTMEDFEAFDDSVLETFDAGDSYVEVIDELTRDLNAEDLSYIKGELEAGNQDMLDLFGVNENMSDADGDVKILSR